LPELGADLAEPIRALVSARPARRTAALPLLLERLARVAGTASLPSYAVLPRPAAVGEARTRRLAALVPGLNVAQIRPAPPRAHRAANGGATSCEGPRAARLWYGQRPGESTPT
jgi:hypothetical protein